MVSFADAVRKQKEAATPAPVSTPPENKPEPKNSTEALANALKNKNAAPTKTGGIKFGIKKNSSSPQAGVQEKVELQRVESERLVPPSPPTPTPITAEQFTHPEQPEKFSEEQVQAFKDAISFMHSSLPHKEESPQAMRIVLHMLEEEPLLNDLLLPEDCGAMVRVLKTSFGVEIAKKQTRSAKQQKSTETQNELEDMLNSLGADFGG